MSSKTDYAPVLNVPLSDALFTVDTRDGLTSSNGFFNVGGSTPGGTGPFYVPSIINNPYDINIQKNQQLFSGAVQRITLTEINMPWNIPNVNPRNDILFLEKDDGTETFITLSIQYYTATELATAVQGALNSGGGVFGSTTWTVSFDARNANFTINPGDGALDWRINPKIGQSKGRNQFTGVNRSSTLAEMMGFNYVNTDYINILEGSYASILYTSYVDVVSSVLCKNQNVRDTSTSYFTGNNILARIYISPSTFYAVGNDSTTIGTRPFMLNYVFATPKEIQWNPEEFLPSCNIRLQDDKGDLLYALPGAPETESGLGFAGNSSWVQLTMQVSEAGKMAGKFSIYGQGGFSL
jgi:hypothetical protein